MKPKHYLLIFLVLSISVISVIAQSPKNIELVSATDNTKFRLSDAKGKYVALHFLLKTECPYCIRYTNDIISKAVSLPNVVQIFIKPDTDEEIKAWSAKLPAEEIKKFPIYRDPDAKLATQFNIPDGYKFHNQTVHYPALILLGPDGKEVFRYIGRNNTDRFSFEQLTAKIHELTGKLSQSMHQ